MSEQKLKALRELSTLLKEKRDVPQPLWDQAGVKVGARMKDVEREIVAVKKGVSRGLKTKYEEEQRAVLEEEAKKQGITVEELLGKQNDDREFNMQLKAARERARGEERVKKEVQRQTDLGEHDLAVDYV
ncbi:hypothetical protein DQ04_02081000 [Trypanosoma grayi]|uniref:hypothetical protein n=1 Tax=Trypanosoma grayi TaxID=71804 RepID=UPI0004F41FCE|nr:hypothetical protein DQ04_02081000 [Trypanosoma grayi]KEG11997.1 hypothetical protein DQ04_02081000 [Trypanosoma grayi]